MIDVSIETDDGNSTDRHEICLRIRIFTLIMARRSCNDDVEVKLNRSISSRKYSVVTHVYFDHLGQFITRTAKSTR
jgi:hypothetical protein